MNIIRVFNQIMESIAKVEAKVDRLAKLAEQKKELKVEEVQSEEDKPKRVIKKSN